MADGTVVFDVGGQLFKTLRQTILRHPDTLLANLLEDIGAATTPDPVFVDANPCRFQHIMDWFRYGEMYVPRQWPLEGLLRDARYFLLPDKVKINGSWHSLMREDVRTEAEVRESVARSMKDAWPGFEEDFESILQQLRSDAVSSARRRQDMSLNQHIAAKENLLHANLLDQSIVDLDCCCLGEEKGTSNFGRKLWRQQACNFERLRLLVAELERRGFECHITTPPQYVALSVCVPLVKHHPAINANISGVLRRSFDIEYVDPIPIVNGKVFVTT
eukprot:TRINITY_DN22012_c0_g1_i2.p1 TRINITY_DN22012_c0_g1~~TRINITY_DN22012_c0_g1_i2.p1  ORF type:complete len:308 (+),score=25.34 TRINITY_DN22012_c0_g1_i2:101-925(+)